MDSGRSAPGGRGRLDDATRLVVAAVPDARVDRPSAMCRARNSCAAGRDDRGVDPRVDHTARDRDLPRELRRQSVFYLSIAARIPLRPSSSTRPTASCTWYPATALHCGTELASAASAS